MAQTDAGPPARAWVVNCSAPFYNLGARKLADWLRAEGWKVSCFEGAPGPLFLLIERPSLICLSVIFSWHAPVARTLAWETTSQLGSDTEVWCGGPGMTALARWWQAETGLALVPGLDARFEHQRGSYRMTFASRGCPVGCAFCIVPRIEGRTFTLDWDFHPAPILCDNNLSALPIDFQEHIIRRYGETGVVLTDANSGFEPLTFDEGTYHRWKRVLKGPWRFAFDEMREAEQVYRMLHLLRGETPGRKRVYVLIGNEPFKACYERLVKVIELGGEPFCQPVLPLNALSKGSLKVIHDWRSAQQLRDLARWINRFLWRKVPLAEYRPRQSEAPPFAATQLTKVPRRLLFPL